ncbi:MAG TPA: GAF domain-containing protein [Kiritimatiellia bacterium]|nr:GAF domain-containing protein [Kiritimatiellia bacterium]HRU70200.1 GAF domain-containing protein [Kiritimatiellia bacterium]
MISQKDVTMVIPDNIMGHWQEIINLVTQIVRVPAALIMRFCGNDIEVLVANRNKENPYHPGDREPFLGSGLYCERVFKTQEKLLVPDALADDEWKDNPDVKRNMISYLGFPLMLPNKTVFGTICVLDNKRNEYSEVIENLLKNFKMLIDAHLEVRYINAQLGEKNKQLSDYLSELQTLRGIVSICSYCKCIRDNNNNWQPIEHYLIRHPEADFSHGICPACMAKLFPE